MNQFQNKMMPPQLTGELKSGEGLSDNAKLQTFQNIGGNSQNTSTNLSRGQFKVNSSADTERGEAVGIPSLTAGVKAAVPKNNLAMAGGSIVGDGKPTSMPNRGQLLKKKTDDNLNVGKPQVDRII